MRLLFIDFFRFLVWPKSDFIELILGDLLRLYLKFPCMFWFGPMLMLRGVVVGDCSFSTEIVPLELVFIRSS